MAARRGGLLLGLAVLAALLFALLVWWWNRAATEGERAAPSTQPEITGGARPSFHADDLDGGAPPISLPPVPTQRPAPTAIPDPAADATTGSLLVRMLWKEDRSPAPDIGFKLLQWDGPSPLFHIVCGETDERGEWLIEDVRPGRVTAYSDRSESESGDVVAGQVNVLELMLPPGTWVRGEVRDHDNRRGGRHAEIWLSDYGNGAEGMFVARAEDTGYFELRGVGDGHYVGARAAGRTASAIHLVPKGQTDVFLTLALGPPGGWLRGRVRSPEGAAVGEASVVVGPERGWPPPDPNNQVTVQGPPSLRLRTDAEGRFAVPNVPAGSVPLAVRADGWPAWSGAVEIVAGQSSEVEVELQPGGLVTGTVRDAAGHAVEGAEVSCGEYASMEGVSARSGADGRYELAGLAPGSRALRASLRGAGQDKATLDVRAGERNEWDPVLDVGLQVFGRIVDSNGAPGSRLFVEATEPGSNWHGGEEADAGGRFVLSNCVAGPVTLAVHDFRSDPPAFRLAVVAGIVPGADEVVVTVPAEREASAQLIGRFEYEDGAAATDIQASLTPKDSKGGDLLGLDAQGGFRSGPMRPGTYRILVNGEGRALLSIDDLVLQAGQTKDVGVIVLETPGVVVVHASFAADVSEASVQFWLRPIDPAPIGMAKRQDDGAYSSKLRKGEYELRIAGQPGQRVASQSIPFRIAAGATTELGVSIERGVLCGVDIRLADDPEHLPIALARVRDSSGGLVVEETLQVIERSVTRPRTATRGLVLRPGSYRFHLLLDGEEVLDVPMNVADLGAETALFEWQVD